MRAMCLAVPGRVLALASGEPLMARVAFGAIEQQVCVAYVPEVAPGDYVIVHAGFAISRLDEAAARRSLALLEQLGNLSELGQETPS